MNLTIQIENPDQVEISLIFNGEEKKVCDSTSVVLTAPERDEYEIELRQGKTGRSCGIVTWILYILFFWLIGFGNILLMNVDPFVKWYQDITPYVFVSRVRVRGMHNLSISVFVIKGSYNEKRIHCLKKPELCVKGDILSSTTEYVENFDDIEAQYIKYIRNFYSVVLVCVLFFAVICVWTENRAVVITLLILITMFIGVAVGTTFLVQRKKKQIYEDLYSRSKK